MGSACHRKKTVFVAVQATSRDESCDGVPWSPRSDTLRAPRRGAMAGDFHGHGGTPIAGWFLLGNIPLK